MVLTTHSMEEADVLCNRIGIVNKGVLRCIGTQNRLKTLYGGGYHLYINCYNQKSLNTKYKEYGLNERAVHTKLNNSWIINTIIVQGQFLHLFKIITNDTIISKYKNGHIIPKI